MSDFPRIRPATVLQRIPKNGVADSAAMNAFMEQVVHDLSEIFSAVNGTVLPILDGLGAPGTNPGMDVVADGLDGRTLPTTGETLDSPYFYSKNDGRPTSVYEALGLLATDVAKLYSLVAASSASSSTTSGTVPAASTPSNVETRLNWLAAAVSTLQRQTAALEVVSALPTPCAALRGQQKVLAAPGAEDALYLCVRLADGVSYAWRRVAAAS